MLVPIPGMSLLKFVVPDEKPPALPPTPVQPQATLLARSLVQKALDVACGVRPLTQLDKRRFERPVHTHLSARLRTSALRGPVKIRSLHVEPAGEQLEIFGTAVCGSATLAYTAQLSHEWPGKLLSFRVL